MRKYLMEMGADWDCNQWVAQDNPGVYQQMVNAAMCWEWCMGPNLT